MNLRQSSQSAAKIKLARGLQASGKPVQARLTDPAFR